MFLIMVVETLMYPLNDRSVHAQCHREKKIQVTQGGNEQFLDLIVRSINWLVKGVSINVITKLTKRNWNSKF